MAASTGSVGVPLKKEATEDVVPQFTAISSQASDTVHDEELEVKRAMRAKRNRKIAAASHEHKMQYIKELERRVDVVCQEKAKMQVSQFRLVRQRLELEAKILDKMKELKREEIHKLSCQMQSA
ncbi:hypothetical protein BWQ96_10294 [Gracilariopsis chorda]|uniref:BZIP domain-containing protein n=1 Tax=Gracilariopsis chorda TaxID=448386 RepID=A0A2V3ID43_9FLOR|nr:hypothetical protein BWQ96_10294 [Gracilariopsis chorda]|eukprot:PXF40002.1 hypothetical protein BWQ96_10294 [Gracilariopsis chorda]